MATHKTHYQVSQLSPQLLQRLADLCSCRHNPDCWDQVVGLVDRGLLSPSVLTLTDEEWLQACLARRQDVEERLESTG